MLAPIVLFVYNRPKHTKSVIEALLKNHLASESDLFIFSDGYKNDDDKIQVKEIRIYLKTIVGFKNISIYENENNKGLANSIIDGVSKVIDKYGKVIVLEDDILTSVGFLKYMNEALELYLNVEKVGCIHAWNYHLDNRNYPESTFFLKGADCWGWATWKRAWSFFNPDGLKLLSLIETKKQEYEFDRKATHDYLLMLKDQISGKNDSWAIRWHASLFVNNKFCLQPTKAIVKNIGLDNSGIHCGISNLIQNPIDFIDLNKIEIKESDWFYYTYSDLVKKSNNKFNSKWQKLKAYLKHLYHQ